MTKSERMKPVVRVAESREQAAAREFGASKRALEEHEQRLAELLTYREEYHRHFQQTGSAGVSAGQFMSFQRFLAQLNKAIEQQRRIVETAAQACECKREALGAARGRSMALDKVVSRYRQEEERHQERREQKETDEGAQRRRGVREG